MRPQVDVVFHATSAERPQFLEEERRGDDRRPSVESEAVLPMDVGAAPGSVELLENGDPVAAGAQAHRGGQTAESAPDDNGSGTGIETAERIGR